jgi:autotransporter-associated beta strand protein
MSSNGGLPIGAGSLTGSFSGITSSETVGGILRYAFGHRVVNSGGALVDAPSTSATNLNSLPTSGENGNDVIVNNVTSLTGNRSANYAQITLASTIGSSGELVWTNLYGNTMTISAPIGESAPGGWITFAQAKDLSQNFRDAASTLSGRTSDSGGTSILTRGINLNNAYALGSGTVSLGTGTGFWRTITTNGTAVLTVGGPIVNGSYAELPSSGLVKSGTGTLVLAGANTSTAGTEVTAGGLSVSSDANLGAAAGGLTGAAAQRGRDLASGQCPAQLVQVSRHGVIGIPCRLVLQGHEPLVATCTQQLRDPRGVGRLLRPM